MARDDDDKEIIDLAVKIWSRPQAYDKLFEELEELEQLAPTRKVARALQVGDTVRVHERALWMDFSPRRTDIGPAGHRGWTGVVTCVYDRNIVVDVVFADGEIVGFRAEDLILITRRLPGAQEEIMYRTTNTDNRHFDCLQFWCAYCREAFFPDEVGAILVTTGMHEGHWHAHCPNPDHDGSTQLCSVQHDEEHVL